MTLQLPASVTLLTEKDLRQRPLKPDVALARQLAAHDPTALFTPPIPLRRIQAKSLNTRRAYRADWCTVTVADPPTTTATTALPDGAAVRRSLARLGIGLTRCRRRRHGDDIDVDAAVEARVDALAGAPHEDDVYIATVRQRRDVAVLVLLDVSGSAGEPGPDGTPVHEEKRAVYLERFIHGGIFEARPDVMAVVHAHAEDILPFGIADGTPLRPVIHSGSFIGSKVPVWDIADNFGDTNLLVANVAQGQDLAQCMGAANVALMRGHGFAAAARSVIGAARW